MPYNKLSVELHL